jgi:hypothetical protein
MTIYKNSANKIFTRMTPTPAIPGTAIRLARTSCYLGAVGLPSRPGRLLVSSSMHWQRRCADKNIQISYVKHKSMAREIHTPTEFCFRTTDPGKTDDIL